MSRPSAFKTREGEASYLAAYDAALKLWPVPCDERDIPTRFGTTHVLVSGPKDAPPLVLLHGYMATSAMWSVNIADFSRDYRVYAVDVMGQPGKSVPDEPVRNAADYAVWLTATLDGLAPSLWSACRTAPGWPSTSQLPHRIACRGLCCCLRADASLRWSDSSACVEC